MNEEMLNGAIAHGKAYRRRLSACHELIWIPDMEFSFVFMNPTGRPIIDFSNCRRMSRGAAHRCINAMKDTPAPLKQFYHDLTDGKPGNGGM